MPDQEADIMDVFEGIWLNGDTITREGEGFRRVAGVHAMVDTAGEISRRVSLTRVVVGGVLSAGPGMIVGALARKKRDDRELYLLIEGADFAWSVSVDPKKGKEAREFVARVNTAARQVAV